MLRLSSGTVAVHLRCHFATLPWLPFSLLLLCFAGGCERDLTPRLAVSGIDRRGVEIDIKNLGQLSAEDVEHRRSQPGVDGVHRVAPGSCIGGCDWAEVSVYIENLTSEPLAPPVIRVDAPKDAPARPPLGVRAPQIDPGRTGRVRWLIELYPQEKNVDVRLSESVFFEVKDLFAATDPPAGEDGTEEDGSNKDSPSGKEETKSQGKREVD